MTVPSSHHSDRKGWLSKWVEPKPLSLFELFSVLGTVATILGIIVLVYQTNLLLYQTDKASEALESSAYQSISSQLLDLDKLFIEKPELRPYFFSGTDLTDADPEYTKIYTQAISVADLQLDYFDSFWTQADHIDELRKDSSSWRAWDKYIRDSFANSPIMCRRLSEVQSWYECDFTDYYTSSCPKDTYHRIDPKIDPNESCK